jgi:hypothetical protein
MCCVCAFVLSCLVGGWMDEKMKMKIRQLISPFLFYFIF